MVMLPVSNPTQFKTAAAFTQFQFLEKAHVGEQAQRAVHRRQRHLHLELHQLLVHVFRTEVIAGAQPFKQFQNTLALRGEASTVLMEALLQCSILVDWGRRTRHQGPVNSSQQ